MMADVAGFEPTVPGLGGRCIIQTMLHARFCDRTLLKKCEGVIMSIFSLQNKRTNEALVNLGEM